MTRFPVSVAASGAGVGGRPSSVVETVHSPWNRARSPRLRSRGEGTGANASDTSGSSRTARRTGDPFQVASGTGNHLSASFFLRPLHGPPHVENPSLDPCFQRQARSLAGGLHVGGARVPRAALSGQGDAVNLRVLQVRLSLTVR